MSFIEGNFAQPKEDIFEKLEKLKGDLTEEESRLLTAELFESQPGFLYNILTMERLFPFQILKCKMFSERDMCLDISARGAAKSFTAAVFCLYYAIINPGVKILVLGPSLRQSGIVLSYMMEIAKKDNANLLRQFLNKDSYKRKPERHSIQIGKSEVFAMSLGDGKKIRGARAQVIILDEAFAIPNNIIDEVIGPMMVVRANVSDIMEIREKEDKMIADGEMTEEERERFKNNKLIMLSSACYEFEPLYKRFQDYINKITNPEFLKSKEYAESQLSYGIINFGWEAIPDELLARGYIQGEKARMSEDAFRREYEAQFSPDSSAYFKMSKMLECTLQPSEYPTIEIRGDDKNKYAYILGIDPNYKNSEDSDHFAMCIMKVEKGNSGKGYVVHNYAVAGLDLSSTMTYLIYLLTHFNIEYIIVDAGGGYSFLETCNNSALFKSRNLRLETFEANYEDEKSCAATKMQYDPKNNVMVHVQQFQSKWIRDANEYLQMCFDHKKVYFASMPVEGDFESMKKEDIPMDEIDFRLNVNDDLIGLSSNDKKKEKKRQFIEHQSELIDLIKIECANINITTSAQGTQSFDLPIAMRKRTDADKPRKDSYSALLLANWGRKCYETLEHTEAKKVNHWDKFRPEMF
jgi:polyhydroxyalkanoate synthesis regulator phasin